MLDRDKIKKVLKESHDDLEWETSEERSSKQEEQLDCIVELLKAIDNDWRDDQEIDDLAFNLGLDAFLYWK